MTEQKDNGVLLGTASFWHQVVIFIALSFNEYFSV